MDSNQALRHAIENLLVGASFNYDQGDTRKLIRDVHQALLPQPNTSQVTFYYSVQDGGYRKNRRVEPRPRFMVKH